MQGSFCHWRWCGLLWLVLALGCSALRLGAESPAVRTAFADADTLLARGRYGEALRAYGEFVAAYPKSTYADDAYLRIAHIYLLRVAPERGWQGWSGADYATARDTLVALLGRYPGTAHRVEVENWVKLLDTAMAPTEVWHTDRDSLPAQPADRREDDRTRSRLEAERQRLLRALQRAETVRDSLVAANAGLAKENAALQVELRQLRDESERMRRMLIDLERRAGEAR